MKRTWLITAGALVLASVSSAANSEAGANHDYMQEVHQFCTGLIASGALPNLNYGECVSYNVVSIDGAKAHVCDELLETGVLEDYFDDFSDCVRNIEL